MLKNNAGIEAIVPNEVLMGSVVQNEILYRHAGAHRAAGAGQPTAPTWNGQWRSWSRRPQAQSRVLVDPPPTAFLMAFADSGINLELGFWIDDPDEGPQRLRSDINLAIWRGFQAAGIEIPFPQREVRVIGQWRFPERRNRTARAVMRAESLRYHGRTLITTRYLPDMYAGYFDLPWWGYALVALALTHVTIAAVTIYLHRHQAHHALELGPVPSHFFRFWLWLTTGMITREWAAIHRKHHAKVDTPDDPHSPLVLGLNRVLWGGVFLYVHESHKQDTIERYGQGTPDDWLERRRLHAAAQGSA